MAIRVIDDTKLNNIAVAIQVKDSGGQMTVDEMPTRIANIPSGGATLIPKTITQNGVYNASSDNADGYDVVTVSVPQDPYEMLTAVMNKTATEIVSDKIKELTTWSCAVNNNLQKVILSSDEFYVGSNANGTTYVFYSCRSLKMLLFPHSKHVNSSYGFGNYYAMGCTNLAIVLIHEVGNTGGSSFSGCSRIKSFIVTKTDSIQVLSNANAFSKSGISAGTGYVYVPDSLKPDYQIATNWSVYSSQIRGYQDAPNYSNSNQYTVGDVCKHNNKFYVWINLTDGNSEPTNAVDTYTDWYCVADIEVI